MIVLSPATRPARRGSLRSGVTRAAIAVGVLASVLLSPGGAGTAEAAAGDVSLTGHGYGHGRGLSQYGSFGYATTYGWDYQRILGHYYGNTTSGDLGNPMMTVRLTALDGRAPEVASSVNFTAANLPVSGGSSAQISRNSDGSWQLTTRNTCGGAVTWTGRVTDTGFRTLVQPTGLRDMLTTCGPEVRTYRGHLGVVWDGGSLRTVNHVLMEDYLRGVVPRESPASWADTPGGINALMSQSVAARSYGWAENRASYAKTCDTTSCQVYGGAGLNWTTLLEDPRTNDAIARTYGQVRLRDGVVARTEFSSSSGGYTAGGTFPAVPDEGDIASPNHNWSTTIPATTVGSAFGVGTLSDITVLSRDGLGADGGRVLTVRVSGSAGSKTVSGDSFRSTLGLKSDWFTPDLSGGSSGDISPVGVGALRAASGQMSVFVRGMDSAVYFRTSLTSGEWGAWASIPGGVISSAPAVISYGTSMEIVGRGFDNRYWANSATLDGQGRPVGWKGWYLLSADGVFSSAPALASAGPNLLTVVGRGLDGAQWQINRNGSAFTSWKSLGGSSISAPTVQTRTVNGAPGYVVYTLASNSRVTYITTGAAAPGPVGAWGSSSFYSRIGVQADAADQSAAPGAVLTTAGTDSVVGLLDTSVGRTVSLGGVITSRAAMVRQPDGSVFVFARGTDNQLWVSIWYPTSGPANRWWALGGQFQ